VRRYEQTVIERNERGYPIAQANSWSRGTATQQM